MTGEFPSGLGVRHPVPDDHGRVVAVLDSWWGRYADRYGRVAGRWGIAHRVVVHEWTGRRPRGEPMPLDAGAFRQGREDRGTGASLGPEAFGRRAGTAG